MVTTTIFYSSEFSRPLRLDMISYNVDPCFLEGVGQWVWLSNQITHFKWQTQKKCIFNLFHVHSIIFNFISLATSPQRFSCVSIVLDFTSYSNNKKTLAECAKTFLWYSILKWMNKFNCLRLYNIYEKQLFPLLTI